MDKKNQAHPPKWILQFFRWFCNPELIEDIEGDLCEKFNRSLEKNAKFGISWWLVLAEYLSPY